MFKLNIVELSIESLVIRFYVMLAGSLLLGFMGYFIPAAIFTFAIVFSCLAGIGIKITKVKKRENTVVNTRLTDHRHIVVSPV